MAQFPKMKQISGLLSALADKAADSEVLKKANNLSDLPDKSSARNNLDVYKKSEVENLVAGATQARKVADQTEFDDLDDLAAGDRVFVEEDDDGKWALYYIAATDDGTKDNSDVIKIADKDLFDNAMSASAVKQAYESNANTNEFSDSEKTKLGYLGLDSNVDLNAVKNTADSAQSDANSAQSDADNAQSTANSAQSDANSAQSTADNALNTANNKIERFVELRETFTDKTSSANSDLTLALDHNIADPFDVQAFVNGIYTKPIFAPTDDEVMINVPYAIEASDEIIVVYKTWA